MVLEFSRETETIRHTYIEREIYFKELAHKIVSGQV